jgi:hypothetical protein
MLYSARGIPRSIFTNLDHFERNKANSNAGGITIKRIEFIGNKKTAMEKPSIPKENRPLLAPISDEV